MPRVVSSVLLFVVLLLAVGCRSSEQSMEKEKVTLPDAGPGIPPNHCRLIGTVVKIEPVPTGGGDDPCSKAPCIAEIRIDEIRGYGSAFGTPLTVGQNLKMKFTYTTSPTKDLFPEMVPSLPGMKVGSKFQADVQSGGPSMGGAQEPRFRIGYYSVQ